MTNSLILLHLHWLIVINKSSYTQTFGVQNFLVRNHFRRIKKFGVAGRGHMYVVVGCC